MIDGVILAGGKATRMKRNKMLVEYKSKPIIYHTTSTMKQTCDNVTIVTGCYDVDYLELFDKTEGITIVNNKDYEKGMFSSVLLGVKNIENDFFLIPGDCPLVKVSTYQKLVSDKSQISVPTYKGRKGHPIFISKELLEELKNENIESNLKVFRDKHQVNYVEVNDPGILFDVDNLEDYQKLLDFERID